MAEVVGGMTGALQGSLTGLVNKGQDWLDRIFPPEKRGELWAKLSKFATEKPLLAVCISVACASQAVVMDGTDQLNPLPSLSFCHKLP